MIYEDGTAVATGDHVWWNEGSCLGFIHEIVESAEECLRWGFDEPHVLLSGFHPSDPGGPGYVAYPVSDFSDEGICKLSPREENDFGRALLIARTLPDFTEPFHVGLDILEDSDGVWVFGHYRHSEFQEIARVKRGTKIHE